MQMEIWNDLSNEWSLRIKLSFNLAVWNILLQRTGLVIELYFLLYILIEIVGFAENNYVSKLL